MSNQRDYMTPAEAECLSHIENERTGTRQELESIQHILWLNFQDSASFTAALCKDRGSSAATPSDRSLIQYQFQRCAIAVTRLYKDSIDAVERAYELGQQSGKQQCRRELSGWAKRKKRKLNRIDLLRQLSRRASTTPTHSSDSDSSDDLSGVLSSLGVASPRGGGPSSRSSSSSLAGEPSTLRAAPNTSPRRESPPSTPPHSSQAAGQYVSRKRKAESLFDEFLETVHSSKRNRQ